jgi:hypothetical protein
MQVAGPGRFCPPHYRYAPEDIARAPVIEAETLYVIGGLYGNTPALDVILKLAEREPQPVTLVFNGDFNWFNIDNAGFENINSRVLKHIALRGNVETELAGDDAGAGCGCVYPANVSDAEVARSNQIEERLRETAKQFPDVRRQLGELAMYAVARVGGMRIAIVHGDAEALAGWGFARSGLDDAARSEWLARCFAEAQVRAFACSHTCLPACRTLANENGPCAIINNGAAGMPNFSGTGYGVITRISTSYSPGALYGTRIDGVCLEALPVAYDQAVWLQTFLKNWPAGSAAHVSYWGRLVNGPAGSLADAMPVAACGVRRGREHQVDFGLKAASA